MAEAKNEYGDQSGGPKSEYEQYNCILMFSGGPDSTTLLKKLLKENKKPLLMYMITGSKGSMDCTDSECKVATKTAKSFGMELETWHYGRELKSKFPHGMMACVHCGGNFIPFAMANIYAAISSVAIYRGIPEVYFAYHKDDSKEAIMYSPKFLEHVNSLIKLSEGGDQTVAMVAPFHEMTKLEVMELGKELGVEFHNTWTCMDPPGFGSKHHCGKCSACSMRIETFKKANIDDKTKYKRKNDDDK
eukprot:CAMPEP_0201590600 /NCGR_PEP_ID=MMETSP0190_2-20130828/179651_1 /ASSEMBLY_ACC=CAM_ASM_000263 /TAXON_ID=37353 /ORGANISM="Rosalina sp." /LENGTH=245 /DNA_ID=CAMNT_0048047097 /DNA_START=14 /DNA_END=751 /DNA_ORIENTATION=+